MNRLNHVILWVYRRMLALYPNKYRESFSDEMEDTFRQSLDDADKRGAWRVLWLLLREVADFPLGLSVAYRRQRMFATAAGISTPTPDSWRRITQKYTLGLFLLLAIFWFLFVAYQNLLLVCRPNCVRTDLRGSLLYRPYSTVDPEFGFSIHLREVDFRDARFDGADLRGGMMRRVNVAGATFTRATLRHADFAWADMRGADFSNADLFRANLYDVDLRSALLVGADLRGADLSNVNLEGAIYSDGTLWPDGFDLALSGAIYRKVCDPYAYCD